MIFGNLFNELIIDYISKQGLEVRCNFYLGRRENFAGFFVYYGIDEQLQADFKHSSKRLEDSSLKIEVVLFVEDFQNTWYTHDETNHLVSVTGKVTRQAIILSKSGNQNGE